MLLQIVKLSFLAQELHVILFELGSGRVLTREGRFGASSLISLNLFNSMKIITNNCVRFSKSITNPNCPAHSRMLQTNL